MQRGKMNGPTGYRPRSRRRPIRALHLLARLGDSFEGRVLIRVERAARLPAVDFAAGEAIFLRGGNDDGGAHEGETCG